jgi:hypothetical protein
MSSTCFDQHDLRFLEYAPAGPMVCRAPSEAMEVVGEALANSAEWVVIPVSRLAPEFFDLRTGAAGELLQKLTNYNLRLAVVGDLSQRIAESHSLRGLVLESNRGQRVWFVETKAELDQRLQIA